MMELDPMDIRSRIEKYQGDRVIQKFLKALYLLGAMPCEMLGEKYPSDKKTHVYGPTGDYAWTKPWSVHKTSIDAFFFRVKFAKMRKTEKKERIVVLPKCEAWAEELYKYFKERGSEKVFPFTRQYIEPRVKNTKIFKDLERRVESTGEPTDFGLDTLRRVRTKELQDEYQFTDEQLDVYGIMILERRRVPKEPMDKSKVRKLKKEYFSQLCKHMGKA